MKPAEIPRCICCQFPLKLRRIPYLRLFGERWVLLENLPAWVCLQCGEEFLTPEAHQRVMATLRGDFAPDHIITVEVYDAIQLD